jgi:D-alanyl-D-alanine carboxypeptidase/D-alanyl-D-alanine-endopeptidase (penicillin-binding protein 4)
LLTSVAVISGGAALLVHPTARGVSPTGAVITAPVLSPRRLPALLTDLVADSHLAGRLDAALGDPSLGPVRDALCMDVEIGGHRIYSRHPDVALLPASNIKLLTALAAVARLGPDARLTTESRAARPPANGVINGSLYLVGDGDPLLVTAGYRASQREFTWSTEPSTRLEDMADRLKAEGVHSITGGVVGDDSRYDTERSLPSWKPSYLQDGEIGAVGALVVNGGFASIAHHVPARAPATLAAAALSVLLQQRGISVGAPPSTGAAPAGAVTLASLDSLPVAQIVQVMIRESDNLSAEMLTKELGRRFGTGGTWSAGLDVVRATVADAGVPMTGLLQNDGSGLDRADRSRCDTLVAAVDRPGPSVAAVVLGLPLAATNGTLVSRMVGQPTAGRIRAKTGSLDGVAALTGFVDPRPGTTGAGPSPAFALLANAVPSDAAGRALEDRVAAILATYPEAPPSGPLAPPGSS